MARFVVDTPITTREPTITVDAGLALGRHRFRLEVIDTAGLRSRPDDAIVEISRIIIDPIPTPIPIPTPGPIVIRSAPPAEEDPADGSPPRRRRRRDKEKP